MIEEGDNGTFFFKLLFLFSHRPCDEVMSHPTPQHILSLAAMLICLRLCLSQDCRIVEFLEAEPIHFCSLSA